MGAMYPWATPEYLLDHMSLEEVFFYYGKGIKFEEYKASLIIHKLNEALDPDNSKKNTKKQAASAGDKPDKAAFYKRHGDKIKRPEGGE